MFWKSLVQTTCASFSLLERAFHSSPSVWGGVVKTKKAAAKRLLRTSKGDLKYGHAGKSHLNGGKSRDQIRRLNDRARLGGVWAKKMEKLL